jgi:uncharacterized coiled-coil protein SlyX
MVLARTVEEIRNTVSGEADGVRSQVAGAVRAAADLLAERGNAVAEDLVARADALNQALDERAGTLSQLLGTDGNAMVNAIEERAHALTSRVSEIHDAILEAITVKGRDVTDNFARTGLDATRKLVEAGDALVATLDERSTSAAEVLGSTKAQLESDITALLDRLTESNALLSDVVANAGDNLGKVETSLSRSAGEFRTAIDRALSETTASAGSLENQTSVLKQVSQEVLSDISSLASRLEDHGRMLSEAAKNLDETNREVDARVGERKTAIEEVADTLLAKTEAVDSLMRTFSKQLESALTGADQKSREVTSMLTAAAEAATASVSEQFESMRLSAGLEGQKAREAVRAAQDDIVAEMSKTLSEASERFTEATTRMRDVARDVHRELEKTRAELKRGILDLPEEAEQSASALRKIVSEQVRALTELSEIVARQSNVLDTSRAGERAATGTLANVAAAAAPARQAPAPEPAAPRQQQPAAPARGGEIRGELRRKTLSDFDAPKQQAPQQAEAPRSGGQSKGWVSDLLRRASQDEAPAGDEPQGRSPLQMVESLNSLSIDIARAIDHETFIDLWDRYKQGERHVFTRRLYTLQGQQTFDEIRQKYARDAEFRSAVDRYLVDFEQLLSQVARNDRDNIMSQTYLTSDTGKVYTMLAHASGRLD